MLKKVTATEFNKIVSASIYTNIDYMEITAKVIQAQAVYFVFFRNDLPQLGFALFEKSKKIILPDFYPLYSGVWLNGSLEKLNLRNDFIESVSELKSKYKSIKICLSPDIQDVRAFIWNGFEVQLRYTYIKELDFDYKKNVIKNYNKSSKEIQLIFDETKLNDEFLLKHSKQLKDIGFKNHNLKNLKFWMFELDKLNFLKTFKIIDGSGLYRGSGIILLNRSQISAGFLLSHVAKSNKDSLINAFLNIEIHQWLKNNGVDYFDYFGANTRNIADFKSRFNPELKSYYIVSINNTKLNELTLLFKRKFYKVFNLIQ